MTQLYTNLYRGNVEVKEAINIQETGGNHPLKVSVTLLLWRKVEP